MMVQFEIVKGYPPLIEEIKAVFPDCMKEGVLFCWDRIIYNPSDVKIPDYLIAHENVHRKQQMGNPDFWWKQYLTDKAFRLAQEVPAHQEEYREYSKAFPNRNMRRVARRFMAQRLSSALYGHMVSFETAKRLIKEKPGD